MMKYIVICIIIIIIFVVLFWKIPYSPQHFKFTSTMKERAKTVKQSNSVCTKEEIARLPKMFQEYCQLVGLEGTQKHNIMHVLFKNTKFVFDEASGKVLDMDYDLWIFGDKMFRRAFCKSSIYGIPFEGIDYMKEEDRSGGMKGYLAKVIPLFDENTKQIYQAGLITIVAESAMLNPSLLLSEYIEYEEESDHSVNVTITYNGISGTGRFTLDPDSHKLIFESNQRQPDEIRDGKMVSVGWRCEGTEYKQQGELMLPSKAKVIKIYPDKDLIYFDSGNIKIAYQ